MRESSRQVITGTVISDVMEKTVVVQVEKRKQHPRYKKYITRRKNYKVHDETNECRLGDTVRCMSTRPISKDKKWRVVDIIRRKFVSTAEIVETDELVMEKERPEHQVALEPEETAETAETAGAEEETPEAPEEAAAPAEEAEETAEESGPEEQGEETVEADAAPSPGDEAAGEEPEEVTPEQEAETGEESDDTSREQT